MTNQTDYRQQWRKYLSYGYRVFSEELLTPNIALIVSPNGSKQIVIGDNEKDPPYDYYEQERIVYVDIRYLRLISGRGSLLFCPSCRQFYIIRCEGCNDVVNDAIVIKRAHIHSIVPAESYLTSIINMNRYSFRSES